MNFEEFDEFTRKLCDDTGRTILEFYETDDLVVETKADQSPVTLADKRAEAQIREAIKVLYPEHGLIGEEYGSEDAEAEFVWVIDPIDGTKSFTSRCPLFGTLIALLRDGEPIYGCINFPALGRRIRGDGKRALVGNDLVRIRPQSQLSEATLLTSDFQLVAEHRDRPNFDALVDRVRLARTWGDCYGYFLLATGGADLMLDPIMNPWDLMALLPIIRGAGGAITDWQGKEASKGDSIVAGSPDLHAQALEILNG